MPWLLLTMFGQCTFCSEIGGLRATGYIEWVLHSIIFISSLRLLSVFTQCRLVLKYRCIVCLARTLHNERIGVKIFPNWFYCYLTVESLLFSGYVYNLTNNMLWIIFVCSGSPKRRPNRMPWLLLTMFVQCHFCSEILGLMAEGYIYIGWVWVLHSIIFISSLWFLSIFAQCRSVIKYQCIVLLARTLCNKRICVKIIPNWVYCYLTVESLDFTS